MAREYYLVEAEKQYALALGRLQTVELATETVVGIRAMERADLRVQAERRAIQAKLDSIALHIRNLYDPEWEPHHIRPIIPRRPPRRRGETAKMAYLALKRTKAPLSAWEIADLIASQVGVEVADRQAIAKLASNITTSLQRRFQEGMIERLEGRPMRWQVPSRKWVRPSTPVALASVPLARGADADATTTQVASANTRPSRRRDAA